MAELVGITASIGGILKVLGAAGVYVNSAVRASREAQDIANQVHATEAILKSLKASLRASNRRSDEFYQIWSGSTKLVLQNMQVTVDELNGKLGSQKGRARLNFWSKAKWPLEREESLALQQYMQAYLQMLSMIQNAFMQGNLEIMQKSAHDIDDIFTEIGTLPTSTSIFSDAALSRSSESTIVPSDSVSQIVRSNPLTVDAKDSLVPYSSKVTLLEIYQIAQGDKSRAGSERLGPGTVKLYLQDNVFKVYLEFYPETLEDFVSWWTVYPIYNTTDTCNIKEYGDGEIVTICQATCDRWAPDAPVTLERLDLGFSDRDDWKGFMDHFEAFRARRDLRHTIITRAQRYNDTDRQQVRRKWREVI